MSKLSKAAAKAHQQACDLLAKDVLSFEERWFVLENWQESANHVNTTAGAFFTPAGLANDFAVDVHGDRIVDLCAGMGTLSFVYWHRCRHEKQQPTIVCVEKNPDYLAVGRKILPEATWICADVFDVPTLGLGRFDMAISNPPFGSTPRNGRKSPRFKGAEFEYHVIDIASEIAEFGTFIIPQMSAPFQFSGRQCFAEQKHDRYQSFVAQTSIELTNGCGVDCDYHKSEWHGVAPTVEIVCAEFPRRILPCPVPARVAA